MSYEYNAYTLGNNMGVFYVDTGLMTQAGNFTAYITCSVLPANRGNFQVEEAIIYTVTNTASANIVIGYKYPTNPIINYNNIVDQNNTDALPPVGTAKRFSRNTNTDFIESNTTMKWCVIPGGVIIAQSQFKYNGNVRFKVWIKGRYH